MTLIAASARRRSSWPVPPAETVPSSGTINIIPTYDGSGKSTHPSVVDIRQVTGSDLSGYRWWLADTPYPDMNDTYENPSIFASNDRINWVVPPGVTNPLAPDPDGPGGPGYNSDVELVWAPETSQFVLYWRDYVATRTPQMYYRTATSPDGLAWTVPTEPLMSIVEPWRSPTISRVGAGDWRMWAFGDELEMDMFTASTALGPWTRQSPSCTLNGGPGNEWHGDVIYHDGVFYGIFSSLSTTSATYPMTSLNGATWNVGARLTGLDSYRPTLVLSTVEGYFDVWLSKSQRVWYYRRLISDWPDPPA